MTSIDPKFLEGDIVQLCVARHYEQRHGHASVKVGNFPDYDIRFSDGVLMEVKVDSMAEKTGNVCIEFASRHKPSGFVSTSSTVWLHIVPEGKKLICYELDTKRLLCLCITTGKVMNGGDGNQNIFKLIPLDRIKELATQVFELNYEIYQRRNTAN
jgi:hypothetical protein